MPASSDNGGHYQVHCSGTIARELRRLQKRAKVEGRGQEVLAAIRRIWERLAHHPSDFGEALYRLPVLRMEVRVGAVLPVFVDFAVCEDRPLVFIKGVWLLPEQEA